MNIKTTIGGKVVYLWPFVAVAGFVLLTVVHSWLG